KPWTRSLERSPWYKGFAYVARIAGLKELRRTLGIGSAPARPACTHARRFCMRAPASCWLVRRRTCVHRPRADLFVGEHACIGLVLACSSASTRAPSRASFQKL